MNALRGWSLLVLVGCGSTDAARPCRVERMAGVPGVNGSNGDGRAARATWLSQPQDVVPDGADGFWIGDANNHVMRHVDHRGVARVVLGVGVPGGGDGGPALEERMDHPTMVLPDGGEGLWVAATGNHRIGHLADGQITFPYGTGVPGYGGDGGPAVDAQFARPSSIAAGSDGTLYVSDRMNQVVRAIGVDGIVTTVAGTPLNEGYGGDGGPATEATLSAPEGSDMDPANRLDVRGDRLVLADTGNHVIREVDLATGRIRTLAGDGEPGFADGPAETARFHAPRDVAIAPDGTVYVADALNGRVRAIADGAVETVAELVWPAGVAVDAAGRWWAADRNDGTVWRGCAAP